MKISHPATSPVHSPTIQSWIRASTIQLYLLLLAFHSAPALADSPKGVSLNDVSVHLFLENKGQWSADVSQDPDFLAWNFHPMGSGFTDRDRFDTFMIKVRFLARGETYEPATIATVRLISKRTKKVIVSKTVRELYVGANREVFVPLVVEDHVCEPMTVEVTESKKVLTRNLEMACGE